MISRKLITFVITYLLCCLEVLTLNYKEYTRYYANLYDEIQKEISRPDLHEAENSCLKCAESGVRHQKKLIKLLWSQNEKKTMSDKDIENYIIDCELIRLSIENNFKSWIHMCKNSYPTGKGNVYPRYAPSMFHVDDTDYDVIFKKCASLYVQEKFDSERMKRIHQHYIRDVYSYEKFIRSAFIQYPHTDCLACTTTYLDSELTKTERLLDYIVQNPDSCEKLNGDMFNTAKEIFINYDMYLRKAVLWISTCVLHQPIDSRYFQRAYRQSPTSNFQNVVLVKNGNSKALDECMHRFVKSSALLTNSNYHLRYFYYDNNNLPETRPDILLELVKRRY